MGNLSVTLQAAPNSSGRSAAGYEFYLFSEKKRPAACR